MPSENSPLLNKTQDIESQQSSTQRNNNGVGNGLGSIPTAGCGGEGGLICIGVMVVLLPVTIAAAGTYYVFKKEVEEIAEDPTNWRTWAKNTLSGGAKAVLIAGSYMAIQGALEKSAPWECNDDSDADTDASLYKPESCNWAWNAVSVPAATTIVASGTALARVAAERVVGWGYKRQSTLLVSHEGSINSQPTKNGFNLGN